MIDEVANLLRQCGTDRAVMAPTELYNEGWLLRLVLDWFQRTPEVIHELQFLPGARWYSEALLAPPFLAKSRGDRLAESYTHADGVIGHFDVQPGVRAEAVMRPDARQLVVIEAKLGSPLSAGVKNAPDYDQAARNVACMANMLGAAKIKVCSLERIAFYVVAPHRQVRAGVFRQLVTKASMRAKVQSRAAQYAGARDAWLEGVFDPFLEVVEVGLLTWESILDHISSIDGQTRMQSFYENCLRYNPQRAYRPHLA